VPAIPSSLLEPVWVQFEALLPSRPRYDPTHPLGCHRPRIPDRVVFEHLIDALTYGAGYERIATQACSDATMRRRRDEWAAAGIAQRLHQLVLAGYHRIVGLALSNVIVDGCRAKHIGGGLLAGPNPVDRAKGGLNRSTATDGTEIILAIVPAPGNRHDSPLLAPTLDVVATTGIDWPTEVTVDLDAGYNSTVTITLLTGRNLRYDISTGGKNPTPDTPTGTKPAHHFGRRWPVERSHAWIGNYGKIRRMTDQNPTHILFYLYLAAALVNTRCLIRETRATHRQTTHQTTRRLKHTY
jgi:Transposase DDE domain